MARVLAIAVVLGAVLAACAPAPPEEPLELETVDVAPPIDEGLSTEGDQQAVASAVRISGLVPGDVPGDLPIFSPSSVVDFGVAGGRSYVELDAGAPPDAVRRWLGERLPAAGWSVDAIGADLVRARKGVQQVDYRLTDLRPGTRIRLEYDPR